MWKLTIEDDEQKQTSLALAHDQYGIGRDETNTIRLTDRNISRRHLILVRNAEGWVVRDLQSYNGTYVNGARVAGEQHVTHGDFVQLGDYRLEFTDERRAPQATLVMEPGAAGAQTPAVAPSHQRPDRLVVVVGPHPGQEFPLDKEKFSIGRSEEATISINHSSVSRLHAELFAIGGGRYEIIDKQSANGIRINGQEVRRGLLEAGDALELGDVRLRFVGAGKIFRGNFDRQMALPAIVGFEGVAGPKAAARAAPSSGMGKIIALGVGIGILIVLAVAAFMRFRAMKTPSAPSSSASAAMADDPGARLLDEAQALADNGDLETAHARIRDIPVKSPSLDDPRVKDIEGKWADSLFDQFAKSSDPDEKKQLVYKIAASPTVDSDRRDKALTNLKEIDPTAEDPLTHPDQPPPAYRPSSAWAPSSATKPPTYGSGKAIDQAALDDPQGVINQLSPRLGTGTLSERELRYLLSLCIQKSNSSCRDKALADLQKLKKPKG